MKELAADCDRLRGLQYAVVEGERLQVENRQLAEAYDKVTVEKRVEGDEMRRDNKQMRLKISKLQNVVEDLRQELDTVTSKCERALKDKESTHDREKKILQKLIKEADKELAAIK